MQPMVATPQPLITAALHWGNTASTSNAHHTYTGPHYSRTTHNSLQSNDRQPTHTPRLYSQTLRSTE
jgi:hypothetical protein